MPNLNPGITGGGLTPPASPAENNRVPYAVAGNLAYLSDFRAFPPGFFEFDAGGGGYTFDFPSDDWETTGPGEFRFNPGSGTRFMSGLTNLFRINGTDLLAYKPIALDTTLGYHTFTFSPTVAPVGAPQFGIPNGMLFKAQSSGAGGGVGGEAGLEGGDGEGVSAGGEAFIQAGGGPVAGEATMRTSSALAKIRVGGSTGGIGFHGTPPQAKPVITGAKGGNAALADLLTKLDTIGILTDTTT